MSIKIQLTIKKMEDPILSGKINDHGELIRVFGLIKLKQRDGSWSKSYPAMIDTGAPISVIPLSRWIQSDVKILTDHEMRGIVEKPDCSTHVSVGRINICIRFKSEGNSKKYKYNECLIIVSVLSSDKQ